MNTFYKNIKIVRNYIPYNYEEELVAITKAFVLFKNIFDPLILLELRDKLGIINECIVSKSEKYFNIEKINFKFYIDKYKTGQCIIRWLTSQNRFTIFECLDKLFYEYNEFLLRIMMLYYFNNTNNIFSSIIQEIITFNDFLIQKLFLLETTYSHMFVLNHIHLYIEYLNNFKIKYNNKNVKQSI